MCAWCWARRRSLSTRLRAAFVSTAVRVVSALTHPAESLQGEGRLRGGEEPGSVQDGDVGGCAERCRHGRHGCCDQRRQQQVGRGERLSLSTHRVPQASDVICALCELNPYHSQHSTPHDPEGDPAMMSSSVVPRNQPHIQAARQNMC